MNLPECNNLRHANNFAGFRKIKCCIKKLQYSIMEYPSVLSLKKTYTARKYCNIKKKIIEEFFLLLQVRTDL